MTKKVVKKSPSKYLQNKKKERVSKARKEILTANERKKINQELLKQEEDRLSIRKVVEAKDVDKYEMLKFYREEYPELSINELKNLIFAETGQQFPLVRESTINLGDLNDPIKLGQKKQAKQERERAKLLEEAKQQKKYLVTHWAHLVIHGTLHLLGYDHMLEAEAEIMENIEITLLKKLGYGNPYE